MSETPWRPELIIGLVGAAGTDLGNVAKRIEDALTAYGYRSAKLPRVSWMMRALEGGRVLEGIKFEAG